VATLSNTQIGRAISALLNAHGPEEVRRLLRAFPWLVSTGTYLKLTQIIANKHRGGDLVSVAIFVACRGFLYRCRSQGVDVALSMQSDWPLSTQGAMTQLLALDEAASADLRIEHANAALEDVEPGTESDLYGWIQYNLGLSYQAIADASSIEAQSLAIAHFEAAVQAWTKESLWLGEQFLQRAQHNLGRLYLQRRHGKRSQDIEVALYWLAQAHKTSAQASAERMDVLILMGNAYLDRIRGERLENIERAICYYGEAHHIAEEIEHKRRLGEIKHNLAVAYRVRLRDHRADNYERAREWAEQALAHYDRKITPEDWARTMVELANIYSLRRHGDRGANLEKAIACAQPASEIYQPETHPRQWSQVNITLGNLYCDRVSGVRAENIQHAIYHFQAALKQCDQATDPLNWTEAMNNLGTVYASCSTSPSDVDYRDATDCFRQALEVRKPETLPSKALQTATNWGGLDFRFGNWDKAWNAFQTALEAGNALYQASSTEAGRRAELAETSRLYARAAYCLLQMGHPDQALLQLEQGKARLLAEALALGDSDLTRLLDSQRQDILEARRVVRELEAEMRLSPDTLARPSDRELAEELQHARATLNRFIEDIRSEHPDFMPTGLDLHGILEQIPQGGALVAPLVTSQGGVVFVLPDGTKTVGMEHVIPLEAFADDLIIGSQENPGWIRAYAAYTLGQDGSSLQDWKAAIENLTNRLWDTLMGPVHGRLTELGLAEGAPVILMPQGGLGLLPLHAAWRLIDGVRRFFLDDYTVSYAPSAYVLSVSHRRTQNRRHRQPALLAVVNPTHDLPYAPIEGNAVAEVFLPTTRLTLVEDDATPEAVVRESAGRTYLHFACHGFYDWEDVMQSALIFAAERRFTLSEIISKLNLNAARLVTLSACETGLTEFQRSPDEYVGLPAGFLQAGAPAVVASLWAVNDLSTALLIKHFYICLLDGDPDGPNEGTLPLSSALRRAQQWLRDKVTAEIAAKICLQRKEQAFKEKEDDAFLKAHKASIHYGLMMPDSLPFAHPVYWAPFALSGQ
jgi:CHAT domain-containing protein/tetratricopeptide (TPR) repeat protein